jgi:hypothetical protein
LNLQEPTPPETDLLWGAVVSIPTNTSLEIELQTGESIRGRFRSANGEELVVDVGGSLRTLPRATIRQVIADTESKAVMGTFVGLGVGVGLGVLLVSLRGVDTAGDLFVPPVLLGGVGAVLGLLGGRSRQNRNILYEAPAAGPW